MGDQQDNGTEPDYRFTLANERTFLAWIRSALGLLAGGVAVHQLAPQLAGSTMRTVLAVACIALAVVLAAASYPRWRRVQAAMRHGEPLPPSGLIPVLAAGVLLIAAFSVALVVAG